MAVITSRKLSKFRSRLYFLVYVGMFSFMLFPVAIYNLSWGLFNLDNIFKPFFVHPSLAPIYHHVCLFRVFLPLLSCSFPTPTPSPNACSHFFHSLWGNKALFLWEAMWVWAQERLNAFKKAMPNLCMTVLFLCECLHVIMGTLVLPRPTWPPLSAAGLRVFSRLVGSVGAFSCNDRYCSETFLLIERPTSCCELGNMQLLNATTLPIMLSSEKNVIKFILYVTYFVSPSTCFLDTFLNLWLGV